jgi:hypothetical protein
MVEPAVSDAPEPSKPTNRLLPDMSNLQEFWQARMGQPGYYNGRLGTPEGRVSPFLMMPDPSIRATVGEAKRWRSRVRAEIFRREEALKSLSALIKERVRVKVYDYIFGWILEDPDRNHQDWSESSVDPKEDAHLFL